MMFVEVLSTHSVASHNLSEWPFPILEFDRNMATLHLKVACEGGANAGKEFPARSVRVVILGALLRRATRAEGAGHRRDGLNDRIVVFGAAIWKRDYNRTV